VDRCKCWKKTQITISIEHCPSEAMELRKEIDRVIHYTMKETNLKRFGTVTMGMLENIDGE
jgi:hypothetical protein